MYLHLIAKNGNKNKKYSTMAFCYCFEWCSMKSMSKPNTIFFPICYLCKNKSNMRKQPFGALHLIYNSISNWLLTKYRLIKCQAIGLVILSHSCLTIIVPNPQERAYSGTRTKIKSVLVPPVVM